MVLEIVTLCESAFSLYWLDFLDYLLKLLMLLNMCRVQGACSKFMGLSFLLVVDTNEPET